MKQTALKRKLKSINEAALQARLRLAPLSESASLDAQTLLANVLRQNRAWLLAHPEAQLTEEQAGAFEAGITRLENGEPLPYVLGEWEFYGLPFFVTSDVLIPRPETEMLVETALDWLQGRSARQVVLDLGTGSGCIAVSLAVHVPELQILASDISVEALEVARMNVERHHVGEKVSVQQGNLLDGIEQKFDLICANLPYIPTDMFKTLDVYQREPTLALHGGAEGLDLITRLLEAAPRVLTRAGMILLEIEASQADSAGELVREAFPDAVVEIFPDLASHPRLLVVQT